MIETSQLQTLVSVAKAQGFSKAAEALGVTQSAISQSIKNLEGKIGTKLFERSGKRVVLTPEGEKLYGLAEGFLRKLDDTLDAIHHDKNSMSGRVRIGTLSGVGKSWLAPVLLDFAAQYPQLSIELSLGFQEDLIKKFDDFELDFLVVHEDSASHLVGEKCLLSEERSNLVFPKGDKRFHLPLDITLDELTSLPTILFQRTDTLYLKWCREHFGKTPEEINTRYVINSHGNMLQAVLKGLGVAVVPNHVLNRSVYRDKIGIFNKNLSILNDRFYIVYHKDSMDLVRMQVMFKTLMATQNPLAPGL